MSPKAQAWALEIVCDSGVQKSVLMNLANRYNEKLGYAFPSIARIARETCWSKSAVENALKGLRASGIIQSNKQYSPSDGSYSSNRYYLIGYSVLVPDPHMRNSVKHLRYKRFWKMRTTQYLLIGLHCLDGLEIVKCKAERGRGNP